METSMSDKGTGPYVATVLATLQNSPTSQNLDFLVSAFTNIGYLAAKAETEAETAEAYRKYEEAVASTDIRTAAAEKGQKLTADQVAAEVTIKTYDVKKAEINALDKARKLKNLADSVEQAINAIKFLGKFDSPINGAIMTPGSRR